MTPKTIKIFINEIYSKSPKKVHDTKKTDVYHIDFIWSLHILDLKDYGPENKKGLYMFQFWLTILGNLFGLFLSKNNAQIIKDSSENILLNSKRNSTLIETARGNEVDNKSFTDLLNTNKIKRYSR